MRLTVLGKSPSWQDAGGACSGYLIEEDGATVVLDCGNGVFSKLRLYRDYTKVDAVVISHLHADHIATLQRFANQQWQMMGVELPEALVKATDSKNLSAMASAEAAAAVAQTV